MKKLKETKFYQLYEGSFGDSGYVVTNYRYKKDALEYVKSKDGFKRNTKVDDCLYENIDIEIWYRIDEAYILE